MRAFPTFYVVTVLMWAIAVVLMVLATRPSLAAGSGCPMCLSRSMFAVLYFMGVSGGICIGFFAAAFFAVGVTRLRLSEGISEVDAP
jgi:hypothetical protein